MVDLATARPLQELRIQVTVLARVGIGNDSSWGDAAWLTPRLATPLPEPSVLNHGVRAVLSPRSPFEAPPRFDPPLWRFVVGFARRSTTRYRKRSMQSLILLNTSPLR